jgi:glyoxalase family protein
MSILGIHHVALVTADGERALDYYTRILGLRLLARDGSTLWLGSQEGELLASVQERPGAQPGHEGVGGTHHFALLVETRDGLLQWKRWLNEHGIPVNGPLDRHYFESIYHRDPDGQVIEIATRGAGWTRDEAPDAVGTEHRPPPAEMVKGNRDAERIRAETWPQTLPEITDAMRFTRMHHVTVIGDDIERDHAFLNGALGLRRVKRTSNFDQPDSFHWYWGVGAGEPGTVVTYFERRGAARVTPGPGQADHYALAVADEAALRAVRDALIAAGHPATEIERGRWFASFRTNDPHGHPVEIATAGRGFDTNGETA